MQDDTFIYFGTPYVASDTLTFLIEHGYIPKLVITNPDAPRGRKQIVTPSETRVVAETHNIPVLTPTQFDDETIKEIASYGASYAVVVAYGSILPEALITTFPKGILNIHYSLLPKYRGASPVETALKNGETETGITIQKMVRKMDAGDIIAQKNVPIEDNDTTSTLRPRLVQIGAQLLIETLPSYLKGTITPTAQDHDAATFAGKLTKADGEIDHTSSDPQNWHTYRALTEGPGTFFIHDGKRYKITKAERAADGSLRILRVIPEGKKETDFDTLF